jgi:hypothetical protein
MDETEKNLKVTLLVLCALTCLSVSLSLSDLSLDSGCLRVDMLSTRHCHDARSYLQQI